MEKKDSKFKPYLIFVSFFVNLLVLVPSVYMIQIYDRVMATQNIGTLISITMMVIVMLLFYSILEFCRKSFVEYMEEVYQNKYLKNPFNIPQSNLYEFSGNVKTYVGYNIKGFNLLLDIPWSVVFIGIQFFFNFWLGIYALVALFILSGIVFLDFIKTQNIKKDENEENMNLLSKLNSITSLSHFRTFTNVNEFMLNKFKDSFKDKEDNKIENIKKKFATGSTIKFFRLFAQSAVLGFAAYLYIQEMVSAGTIIACSILMGRILAPIDQISNFLPLQKKYEKSKKIIEKIFNTSNKDDVEYPISKVEIVIGIEEVNKNNQILMNNIKLKLKEGQCLLVLGETGSGKSLFLKSILSDEVGIKKNISINKIPYENFNITQLQKLIGFAPQEMNFFDGTISENIAFGEANEKDLIESSKIAGCYDFIVKKKDGFNSKISGDDGEYTPGQLQKISNARAFYGDPKIIILDEPSSMSETVYALRLINYLNKVKSKKIIILTSHQPEYSDIADQIMVLKDGKVLQFGNKKEVLSKILRKPGS